MPTSLTADQFHHARAALVVGIDDYRAYAESRSEAPNRWALHGSAHDVRRWRVTLRHLMVIPGKTEVVVAPRTSPGAPRRGTRAEILGAYDRFLDHAADSYAPSVAVFVGRGAWCGDRGLLFCPSDTTGPALSNAIPLRDLFLRAAHRIPGKPLVFLFDCGFTTGERDVPWARSRALPFGHGVPSETPVGREIDLVLWAGARSRPVTERRFGGRWRGPWSWALQSSLEQAAPGFDDGPSRVTWGDAAGRAGTVLAALTIPQAPSAQGATSVAWSPATIDPTSTTMSTMLPQIHAGTMGLTTDTNPPVTIGYVTVDNAQSTETWAWSPGNAWPTSFRMIELTTNPTVPATWTKEVQPFKKFNLNADPVTALPAVTWAGKTYTITRVVGADVAMPAGWMRVRTDTAARPQFWYQYATEYMEIGVATDKSDRGKTWLRFVVDNGTPGGPVFQTG